METIRKRQCGRVTLVVRSEYDQDLDTSYLGEAISHRQVQWDPKDAFYSIEDDAIRLPKSDVWRDRKGRIVAEPERLDYYNVRYHGDLEFLKLSAENYLGETRGVLGYLFQDADRLRTYYRGDWCYLGIVATVKVDGKEMGSRHLAGVSSPIWGIAKYKRKRVTSHPEALAEAKAFLASLRS